MAAKRWLLLYVVLLICAILPICALVLFVDPYFHFHKPLTNRFYYILEEPRYVNDGIAKHFDFDAIITGTSMTHNFLTRDFDQVFGCNSVKLSFNAATFYETNNVVKTAIKNRKLKYVISSVDNDYLLKDKDFLLSAADFPEYLYNNNPFDDLKYLLNSKVIERSARALLKKKSGIDSFDEFSNFGGDFFADKKGALRIRDGQRFEAPKEVPHLTEKEKEIIRANVTQNFIDVPAKHPETQFYYFFPPYSAVYWGQLYESGELNRCFEAEKIAVDLMLQLDNVHVFAFNTNFDVTCNLENYMDQVHYGAWINAQMLRWMKQGEFEFDKSNAAELVQKALDFYSHYDYNSLF